MKKVNLDALEIEFREAVALASSTSEKFPQDILLQFYACYKYATNESTYSNTNNETNEDVLRNSFKMNALLQLNNITQVEAKQRYIKLVNTHIKNKN